MKRFLAGWKLRMLLGAVVLIALVAIVLQQRAHIAKPGADHFDHKAPISLVGIDANPATPPNRSNDEAIDPVEAAMKKARGFLYAQQQDGHWDAVPQMNGAAATSFTGGQWSGLTGLAVHALLTAGENAQVPQVANAIAFLEKSEATGTRALSLRISAMHELSGMRRLTPDQKKVLKKDATLLMNATVLDGGGKGMFPVTTLPQSGPVDVIFSGDAILGMSAAGESNLEIPTAFWKMTDEAWRKRQLPDYGWSDGNPGSQSTMGQTAAAVASLLATQQGLNLSSRGECKGNIEDKEIATGITWIGDHSNQILNDRDLPYLLYTLGRIGRATGNKYFGKFDWYNQGVAHLLLNQNPDGSWDSPQGAVAGTAWAMLFLQIQRDPVMMNKLRYSIDQHGDKITANWNQRPHDVANIVKWIGPQLCEWNLNWHIVDLSMSPDDLHEAAILYIAGNQTLTLTKADKEKLKEFVEQGGMILGHPDCNDSKFAQSFENLGQELFPDYQFRNLPADHPIFHEMFQRWDERLKKPSGLSNGVRELMLLLPGDPARFWEIKNFYSTQTRPGAELMANIWRYADNRPYRDHFEPHLIHRDESIKAKQTLSVARLQYHGNWNPEPGGWMRLANIMHNQRGIDLDVHEVPLGAGQLAKNYAIAHLTGTEKFQLDQGRRAEIQAYIQNGGTLIIDSAGGSSEFADSAREELNTLFGVDAKQADSLLPAHHAMFSAGPQTISKVSYRYYAYRQMVGRIIQPRIRGIDINGRTAVFFSREDLTAGLTGTRADGIIGYEPSWASELMANMIQYSAK